MISDKKSYKVNKINPTAAQDRIISDAAGIIKRGGIVLFPTKCLYGLGADAFNFKAVERIFNIKNRSHNKPVLVLVKNRKKICDLVKSIPQAALNMMDRFWPGGLTIVFEAKDTLPKNLTAGTGKIGIRLPKHPVASALVSEFDGPVTGTSANFSGKPGCMRIDDLDFLIANKVDLVLDAGLLKGGPGSTVVDVTTDFPKILREGEIPAKDILNFLYKGVSNG